MVDIVIDGANAGFASLNNIFSQGADIHIGGTKYVFYLPDANTLAIRKSDDDGLTYAPGIVVFQNILQDVQKVAWWFDQDTPGISGTKIHWALLARENGGTNTSSQQYRNLDTATDILGAAVALSTGGVQWGAGWIFQGLSITKARSGRLCIQGHQALGATDNWFVVSDNDGLTWTPATGVGSLASASDQANPVDKHILLPGNEADLNDVYDVYLDASVPHFSVKRYNTVGDVWTETVFPAGGGGGAVIVSSGNYLQYAAATRVTDGHGLVAILDEVGVAGPSDINLFEIVNATTVNFLSTVIAGDGPGGGIGINVDRVTGDIRVAYTRGGPFEVSVTVSNFVSTDGGASWGARVDISEDAASDLRYLTVSRTQSVIGGRFMPVWHDDNLSFMLTNFNKSVPLGPPPTPIPPPEIVPAGGTYGAAPGAPPGTIVYITPDTSPITGNRIEYPLVTPHHTGRFVMSFSGFGTPDIQYISQRGPFQDGETVRDFHLRPRVVQLLERQQFKSRAAWWDGRADILNDLRPNRQITATAVVPGTLRMVTSNGDVRDLNVFIESGPRFEARNVNEWDEFAFEEVLRFVAHDPLFFDPTRVDLTLAFALDLHLIFPITFPIQFGGGVVDVSTNLDYTGTWASLPTIVIEGPLDSPIIDNVTTGETIDLRRNIGPERTVTIDLAFGQKTITDDLGTNLLGSLSTDSNLGTWHIAPTPEAPQVAGQPRPTGRNVIRLRGSNPTGSTSVEVRYFTRYVGI